MNDEIIMNKSVEDIKESTDLPEVASMTDPEVAENAVDPLSRKLFVDITNEISALPLPNGCLIKVGSDVTFVPGIKMVPAADKPAPKGRGFTTL